MTPQEAKAMWVQYLEPLRKNYGVRLGSPPTSSAPSGKTWTQEFLSVCGKDCNVDFIALRTFFFYPANIVVSLISVVEDWYDTNSTAFTEYITDFHNTFQRPIWVTEWACHSFNSAPQCSQKQTNDFMAATQGFMDKTDWVERYSWFGAMPDPVVSSVNSLVDKKGSITPLGKQYIGDGSVYKTLRPSTRTDGPWPTTDSNDTLGSFPQIGLSSPCVLPPLAAFRTLGRVIVSIGVVVVIAVIAFC